MRLRRLAVPLAAAVLLFAAAVQAEPALIAIGSIPGTYEDFALETAAPLENGVPGNRLGGIGSGLAHAGGNIFLALPDRGPNAKAYNAAVGAGAERRRSHALFHRPLGQLRPEQAVHQSPQWPARSGRHSRLHRRPERLHLG